MSLAMRRALDAANGRRRAACSKKLAVSDDVFRNASWYRALTLEERAELLRHASSQAGRADIDEGLARRELDAWRSQPPFDRGEWFARYLAADGLEEEELGAILVEPVERVAERVRARPEWLTEIEHAYGSAAPSAQRPTPSLQDSSAPSARRSERDAYAHDARPSDEASARSTSFSEHGSSARRFLGALSPLIESGRSRLERRAADLAARERRAPFDAHRVADLFLDRLLASLHVLVERVFVLELNVARLQGELEGANAAERFDDFVRRMRRPERATALLAEYPVLARRAVECIAAWERASLELLEHVCADWTSLWAAFSPERDPGRVARILGGAGDVHRGGRSVAIVEFESGLRVVYKPRSLAVDVHFQELLAWIDHVDGACAEVTPRKARAHDTAATLARRERPRFRTLRVLDRRDHGWVEFVEPRACGSRDELTRFYWRQGAQLALLHALEAVDFHFENLIAAGEHPVLIDLETLFHPRLPEVELADADHRLVREATSRSVLRTGLLPNRAWSGEGEPASDVSGLGGGAGELTPDALLQWSASGTDEMQATKARVPMPAGKNLPTIGNDDALAIDHVEDVVAGFDHVSRLLMRHRDALLRGIRAKSAKLDEPIARFAHDDVRVVLRPTRAYGLLLSELTHPDFMRDALEVERLLDKLWVGVDDAPHMIDVIGAERRDLASGDIPFFAARPSSRELHSSRGDRWADFVPASGFELVEQRLRSMNDAEVERQAWFIRGAFATSAADPDRLRWPSYAPIALGAPIAFGELSEPGKPRELVHGAHAATDPFRVSPSLHSALIDRARKIGDRLHELALRDSDGNAAWIGFKFEDGRWQLVPLTDDLYSGILGVVHFLAYLGALTGEQRYTSLARAALAPLRRRIREGRTNLGPIGPFNGLGGIVYTFAHWSRLWNDAALLDDARATAELAAERIDADDDLDIIGGAAGLIVALASLRHAAPSERWLEIERRCGQHLLARTVRMERGLGWSTRIGKDRPATGFSHGASGIAFALHELWLLTRDARYRDAAEQAIEYEASQFDDALENWLDPGGQVRKLRTQDATLMVAWCYGAPGIGLARLALRRDRAIGAGERACDARQRARSPGESSESSESVESSAPSSLIERDLAISIKTTRARGFGRNHSLCHGDLGNLDFLWRAARIERDRELAEFVQQKAAIVLASIERDGVLCGMPLGIESVALMNGLAGVGFGLLHLAEPERVPSVLTLAPPCEAQDATDRSASNAEDRTRSLDA